ncbi:hypothetical protein [Skermania piniformis]|uniref:LppU protein n=1 Tax=Skermania pinensis TaxID=39122 RepID=A0ABX8SBB5_9ACTN|nr:hypothetical protein [Skermania piniformis]QXQ13740.1 hypothetical protein KV203_18425 [Skermania piniformis]
MANKRVGMFFLVGPASLALLVGCADRVTGSAVPVSGAGMVEATAAAPSTSSSRPSSGARPSVEPKSTPKADSGGDIDFQAEIGECVRLGGTVDDATIRHADCGSPDSNYRIIGKAPTDAQCIADADAYYAETLGGTQTGALCLDIDWAVDTCMDLSGADPQRIDCGASTTDGVRVVAIQQHTDDVDGCPSDGGFVYAERHFVVCTEDL